MATAVSPHQRAADHAVVFGTVAATVSQMIGKRSTAGGSVLIRGSYYLQLI